MILRYDHSELSFCTNHNCGFRQLYRQLWPVCQVEKQGQHTGRFQSNHCSAANIDMSWITVNNQSMWQFRWSQPRKCLSLYHLDDRRCMLFYFHLQKKQFHHFSQPFPLMYHWFISIAPRSNGEKSSVHLVNPGVQLQDGQHFCFCRGLTKGCVRNGITMDQPWLSLVYPKKWLRNKCY